MRCSDLYGTPRYAATIREHLIDVKPDGSFRLNMEYFNYPAGLTMTNTRFHAVFRSVWHATLRGNDSRAPDRREAGRFLPAEHGIFQLPGRADHDQHALPCVVPICMARHATRQRFAST